MKVMVFVLNHGGLARFARALKSADSLRDACINFIFYKLWNFIFHKILRCTSYFYGSAHISYPLLSRLKFLAAWCYFVRKILYYRNTAGVEF